MKNIEIIKWKISNQPKKRSVIYGWVSRGVRPRKHNVWRRAHPLFILPCLSHFFPLLFPFWLFHFSRFWCLSEFSHFFLLLVPFDFSSLSLFLQHFLKFMTREVNEKWIRHTWLLKEPLPVYTPKIFLVILKMPSECTKRVNVLFL